MKTVTGFVVLLVLAGCNAGSGVVVSAKSIVGANSPERWERGWKTSRVTAAYWPNAAVGYSLEFTFPKNADEADREELSDTFADFGCAIYQGGGFPGAPAYVSCDSVKDNASADAKLKELLPALDDVLTKMSLTSGPLGKSPKTLAREAAAPKTTAEWIERENAKKEKCEGKGWSGSGTDGYDSWSENCVNGVVVYSNTTEETQKQEAEANAHKAQLADALLSRCLTAKEFKEVASYGYDLYTRNMVPYSKDDLQSRFNAALQTQQILRMHCPTENTGD